MWRKVLLASASFMTLAGTALAADLAPPPPPPPPVFTWTGLYVGAYGGGEITHTSYDTALSAPFTGLSHLTPVDIAGVDAAGSQSLSRGGFTAGVQGGYNYQIGMFVLGVETDVGGVTGDTHSVKSGFITGGTGLLFPSLLSQNADNGLFGTVRGRLGIAFDRVLIYGTGGFAYTSGSYSLRYFDALGPSIGFASEHVNVGWTAGGGLEYSLTPNVSVKGEFLYSQFGRSTASGLIFNTALLNFTNPFVTSSRVQEYAARLGLNYHFVFAPPAPVVAKY